jgi:DnaA family protein
MSGQLVLPFAPPAPADFDAYVADGNEELVAALRRAAVGGRERLWISGPGDSGRTHLLLATAAAADAAGRRVAYVPCADLPPAAGDPGEMLEALEQCDVVLVDDVDRWAGDGPAERALFDLYNRVEAVGRLLVFCAAASPDGAGFALPDLRSRGNACLRYRIRPLEAPGLEAVLRRRAQERGLELPEATCAFLLARLPRVPGVLARAVDHLDEATLAHQRRVVTVPFVREHLDALVGA